MSNILERAKAVLQAGIITPYEKRKFGKVIEELITEVEDLRGKYQYMVDCAANEKLDGYRELGKRAADAEAEVERLRSDLFNRREHLFVNATPDGGYAMRILQSYRACCDVYVSDNITGGPTNPLCIAMNEANAKRKTELDQAISDLASASTNTARIKELEAQLKEIEDEGDGLTVAYMLGGKKKAAENKILIDYIKRLEAAFLQSETERIFCTTVTGLSNDIAWKDYPETPQNGIHKEWFRQQAREELERIKEGGKDEQL